MKTILIIEENRAEIEAALKAVNGRAFAHTFTELSEITNLAHHAEIAVAEVGLAESYRVGARYTCASGRVVASNYKGARKGTAR